MMVLYNVTTKVVKIVIYHMNMRKRKTGDNVKWMVAAKSIILITINVLDHVHSILLTIINVLIVATPHIINMWKTYSIQPCNKNNV